MRTASGPALELTELIATLHDLADRCALDGRQPAPRHVMDELWRVVTSVRDEPTLRAVTASVDFSRLRQTLAVPWAAHIREMERVQSDRLVSHPHERGGSVLATEGYAGVGAELATLAGRTFDRAVVVGCGAYPETMIALGDHGVVTDRGVALDRDPVTVRLANKILSRHRAAWPGTTVRAHAADGRHFDYREVGLVFLANGLTGKRAVLEQVARTGPPDIAVLARTPVGLARLLYEDAGRDGWRTVSTVEPTPMSRTLLLAREGTS